MNYYGHHINDYRSATAHLSWDEDAAYRRLLDIYYATEKPLPADIGQVCRLARASKPAQRAAVDTVLCEFFTLEDDGWHNKRCDEEILLATERARRSRENGTRGGRPPKPDSNPAETQQVVAQETQQVPTRGRPIPHSPLPNSSEANASGGEPPQGATLLDLKTELWRRAVAFLESREVKPSQTRPLVGRWIKALGGGAHGQTALLHILTSAEANCQGGVIEYVEASIERDAHGRADAGEDRNGFGAVIAAARAVAAGH